MKRYWSGVVPNMREKGVSGEKIACAKAQSCGRAHPPSHMRPWGTMVFRGILSAYKMLNWSAHVPDQPSIPSIAVKVLAFSFPPTPPSLTPCY